MTIIHKDDTHIRYKQKKLSGNADTSWYRGDHCNFNPATKDLLDQNCVADYILHGWLPEEPFITKDMKIVAFGSCFATNITNYLSARKYNLVSEMDKGVVEFKAGVNNTFALRQLFEWVYNDREFAEENWHTAKKKIIQRNNIIKRNSLAAFNSAKVFIITVGLNEVWYNKVTNDVFWRAIPTNHFNPKFHGFRVPSFQENKENIQAIYDLIQEHNPEAKIIFTLSPISLAATFRPVSCITANCASKSTLRSVLDEFCRDNDIHNNDQLYYWPSYEIVNYCLKDPYQADNRHVKRDHIQLIMKEFDKYYTV